AASALRRRTSRRPGRGRSIARVSPSGYVRLRSIQDLNWLQNKVNPEDIRHRVAFSVAGPRFEPTTWEHPSTRGIGDSKSRFNPTYSSNDALRSDRSVHNYLPLLANAPIQPAMARPISSGESSWTKWTPATVTSVCAGHAQTVSRFAPPPRSAPGSAFMNSLGTSLVASHSA